MAYAKQWPEPIAEDVAPASFDQLVKEDQIEKLRESFTLYDQDDDGVVNRAELREILRSMGKILTETDVQKMVNSVETHLISFPGFLTLLRKRDEAKKKELREEEFRQVFEMMDTDKNGFISIEELRMVLTTVDADFTFADAENLVREADSDGDGQIDFEEFVAMISERVQAS